MSDILDIPMFDNDANASTVGEYLVALLQQLWSEEEGFSGKRPFGNSGWKYDVYSALVHYGKVEGTLDETFFVIDVDECTADALISQAISDLYEAKNET